MMGILWQSAEIIYEIIMIRDKNTYNSLYRRYTIIGTSIGKLMTYLIDYKPEEFEDHFSPQDYYKILYWLTLEIINSIRCWCNSLYCSCKEPSVKITSHCIINESPFLLRQGSCLIFKHGFLVPFALKWIILLACLI